MDLLERDEHLQRIAAAMVRASRGKGCLVAIAGEAGTGKTSLIQHFSDRYTVPGQVIWGACEDLSTPEPLLPLRDVARSSGRHFNFDAGATHMSSFESLLSLLSGADQPSVLIIEDMHWADAATLDMIRFLSRRIARTRALILISYRGEELSPRSPLRSILGEAPPGSIERLTLGPLSKAAVNLLCMRVGRDGEALFALTGGNPFLVTEALAVEGDVPAPAVRDATLARASRLPEGSGRVLEAVSIFPRRAPAAIVALLLDEDIEPALGACIERGMLVLGVLVSSLALVAIFFLWQPIGVVIWRVSGGAGRTAVIALYLFGWAWLLYTTFLIDHFDLFGLKQVWRRLFARPYVAPRFHTPSLYRVVRHPLYIGWLIIFWSAPTMTVAHLVFAVMTTAYILVAIQLEERDLVQAHPEYAQYRARVPMLVPSWSRGASVANKTAPIAERGGPSWDP